MALYKMYLFSRSPAESDSLDKLKDHYIEINKKPTKYCVFYLGDRGIIAEIEPIVRAMIYCIKHSLQFVLDSEFFVYAANGWEDYFENFWGSGLAPDINPDDIEIRIFSARHRDKRSRGHENGFNLIMGYRTPDIQIGDCGFGSYESCHQMLYKMIFRLNPMIAQKVSDICKIIEPHGSYDCVHIRRGDKVEGKYKEDIYYPTSLYLQHLSGKNDIFVMSDDYKSVREVKELSESKVFTLCPESRKGFNIGQIREKKNYFNHDDSINNVISFEEFTMNETVLLLSELWVGFRSNHFVGTQKSNVSYTIELMRRCYEGNRCIPSKHYLIKNTDIKPSESTNP